MRNGRGAGSSTRADREALISAVCGAVGILIFGILLGAVAVALGLRARRAGAGTAALVGIVLGILAMVLWIASAGDWHSVGPIN